MTIPFPTPSALQTRILFNSNIKLWYLLKPSILFTLSVFWVSFTKQTQAIVPRTGRSESAGRMSFAERTSFSLSAISLISSDKGSYRTHLSVLWFGKVILRDSKTKSFPSICYDRQEEIVVVTASFVTRKTYLGNLGWSFSTTYPEERLRLENISSVQGNIILCEKLKTNLCGKLRNNNRCKIVSLSHAFATKY